MEFDRAIPAGLADHRAPPATEREQRIVEVDCVRLHSVLLLEALRYGLRIETRIESGIVACHRYPPVYWRTPELMPRRSRDPFCKNGMRSRAVRCCGGWFQRAESMLKATDS